MDREKIIQTIEQSEGFNNRLDDLDFTDGSHRDTRKSLIAEVVDQYLALKGLDEWEPTHIHLKSQGLYQVVDDDVRLEASNTSAVMYKGEDGTKWVRDYVEFFDGRFEPITPPKDMGGEK